MSTLMQRLHGLDGNPALARGVKEQWRAKADRLLLIALYLAALTPATLPSLTDALIWPLEARFERTSLDDHNGVAGFIALGGGDERIREAARLARAHPGAKLVITGHGEKAVRLAHESGLPPERVIIEPAAQNTFENAQFTAPLLGKNDTARWVLVTSASHMPRAIGCFRKAHVAIEAWPVDDVSYGWRDRLSTATHEWLGMLAYRLRGRTDTLFPAPQERPIKRAIVAANAQAAPITN
jgi:uncharacterized SAM-binding protein YcdF (DUF218 family)